MIQEVHSFLVKDFSLLCLQRLYEKKLSLDGLKQYGHDICMNVVSNYLGYTLLEVGDSIHRGFKRFFTYSNYIGQNLVYLKNLERIFLLSLRVKTTAHQSCFDNINLKGIENKWSFKGLPLGVCARGFDYIVNDKNIMFFVGYNNEILQKEYKITYSADQSIVGGMKLDDREVSSESFKMQMDKDSFVTSLCVYENGDKCLVGTNTGAVIDFDKDTGGQRVLLETGQKIMKIQKLEDGFVVYSSLLKSNSSPKFTFIKGDSNYELSELDIEKVRFDFDTYKVFCIKTELKVFEFVEMLHRGNEVWYRISFYDELSQNAELNMKSEKSMTVDSEIISCHCQLFGEGGDNILLGTVDGELIVIDMNSGQIKQRVKVGNNIFGIFESPDPEEKNVVICVTENNTFKIKRVLPHDIEKFDMNKLVNFAKIWPMGKELLTDEKLKESLSAMEDVELSIIDIQRTWRDYKDRESAKERRNLLEREKAERKRKEQEDLRQQDSQKSLQPLLQALELSSVLN